MELGFDEDRCWVLEGGRLQQGSESQMPNLDERSFVNRDLVMCIEVGWEVWGGGFREAASSWELEGGTTCSLVSRLTCSWITAFSGCTCQQ